MKKPSELQITELLKAWSDGDESALNQLIPLVEEELHRLAQRYMARQRRRGTLQTTALVNNLYLKLVRYKTIRSEHRGQFYRLASTIMRHILVDLARKGEFREHVPFDQPLDFSNEQGPDMVALDDALTSLAIIDPRKSQVVELRFFGGLSVEEIAELLKVSTTTVQREWRLARMWLRRQMSAASG